MKDNFDLLSTVEYGGCSAKIPAGELSQILQSIPLISSANVMVDISTHDDAGVYRLDDNTALIVTTDFFPPVCSDAYEFGEIAAANSLSDVYAMGGKPLLVLNLNMFPTAKIPISVLGEILRGGQSKINQAHAITMGGHTIEDYPPKYGLAVVGTVHPDRLITNSGASVGQKLILTKALGSGVLVAAQRMGIADQKAYRAAIEQMKQLNDTACEMMQKYSVRGATDITGFGLLGHCLKLAQSSDVSIQIHTKDLPRLDQSLELLEDGCIPGAAFRNLDFVKPSVAFSPKIPLAQKMLACDAQTSGGMLICVDADKADDMLADLQNDACPASRIIGSVVEKGERDLFVD